MLSGAGQLELDRPQASLRVITLIEAESSATGSWASATMLGERRHDAQHGSSWPAGGAVLGRGTASDRNSSSFNCQLKIAREQCNALERPSAPGAGAANAASAALSLCCTCGHSTLPSVEQIGSTRVCSCTQLRGSAGGESQVRHELHAAYVHSTWSHHGARGVRVGCRCHPWRAASCVLAPLPHCRRCCCCRCCVWRSLAWQCQHAEQLPAPRRGLR